MAANYCLTPLEKFATTRSLLSSETLIFFRVQAITFSYI